MGNEAKGSRATSLVKCPSGIEGLDEITRGGLPEGRPSLVCGGPGCGKTVLVMEFLINGARRFGEPGLFVSFEENASELAVNFAPMGFDLASLISDGALAISHVNLRQGENLEAGEFTLEGLFIRLATGIDRVGAQRVAIDGLEMLFAHMSRKDLLRAELGRLFEWLKDRGVTSVITGERGDDGLTRHGFEEYLSDCVLLLDHRVTDQISKRRLRVVKYRGSAHGKDEYPFLIGDTGITVLPISSVRLDHPASTDRVSTGVADLDAMLGGQGYFRGSSVLISGPARTGKSTLAAAFAAATCRRGEACLLLAFEESAGQIVRNMRSVGQDLQPWIDQGLLRIQAKRPTLFGLEEHLAAILTASGDLSPRAVIMDPITNFLGIGGLLEVKSMLTRVLDTFRSKGVTLLLTSLSHDIRLGQASETQVSSLMDTWIALDQLLGARALTRQLYLVKSRGMKHSHALRELVMSDEGLSLAPLDADKASQGAS